MKMQVTTTVDVDWCDAVNPTLIDMTESMKKSVTDSVAEGIANALADGQANGFDHTLSGMLSILVDSPVVVKLIEE